MASAPAPRQKGSVAFNLKFAAAHLLLLRLLLLRLLLLEARKSDSVTGPAPECDLAQWTTSVSAMSHARGSYCPIVATIRRHSSSECERSCTLK